MPSRSAASENVVVYCAGLRCELSLSVKHQTHPPPPGHVSHSVCFTRCSALVSAYSGPSNETIHAARRPTARRYKEAAAYRTISRYRDMKRHDISISLLGYDMITKISITNYALLISTQIQLGGTRADNKHGTAKTPRFKKLWQQCRKSCKYISGSRDRTNLGADKLVRNVQLVEMLQLTDDLLILQKRRTLLFQFGQCRGYLLFQHLKSTM